MTWLRDWLGWAAAWTLVVHTPIWLAVAAESWQERTDPTLDAMPVPSWVPDLAYAAAALVPLALLLVVLGTRSVAVRRLGLLLGAAGLGVGAVAFSGFPDGDVGGWYVGLTALAAGLALLAALAPDGEIDGTPPAAAPGLALVAAGLFAAWTCWRGASYWDWRGDSALTYEVGLGLSAVLIVLGATAARWVALEGRVLRWVLVLVGVAGALYFLAGVSTLAGNAVLYRWEEDESAWAFGTPFLLLGVGPLAAGVAAWRRRGDLVAWSLASGVALSLVALWQQSTWGRVMG